jgi:GAF domain-containing protein
MKEPSRNPAMKEILRNPDTFHKILQLTISSPTFKEMIISVFDELRDLFGCDRCSLYAVDRKANEIYTLITQKYDQGAESEIHAELAQCEREISRLAKAIQFGKDDGNDDSLKLLVDSLSAVTSKKNSLASQLDQIREGRESIRLPLDKSSVAAFVAISGVEVMIADLDDLNEMKKIDAQLAQLRIKDRVRNYRTVNMIAVPLMMRGEIIGTMEAMNKPGGFMQKDLDAMRELSMMLTPTIYFSLPALKGNGGGKRAKQ